MSLQSLVARLPYQVHLPDDTLSLARDGYAFIGNRCRELGTDVFETRLFLQRTICMLGAEAARVFYDPELVQREGAGQLRVQAMLFGRGGVQGLDGAAHHVRKQMFLRLMGRESIARLCELVESSWHAALPRWPSRVVLFDEAQTVLCRAVCAWAGVTLDEERRIRDLGAMIDGSTWRGRVGRARAEWWLGKQIEQVRAGTITGAGALGVFASSDLDTQTAAIELLSAIRPTVAIARYVTFAALALHEHPHAAELVRDPAMVDPFVQEVRRFFPFVPAVVGRIRRTFTWHGVELPENARVMLDLYGTNHDARTWEAPEAFRPQRFIGWHGDTFTLIPQGGGELATGHRCPGEALTVELLKTSVRYLTRALSYDVPPQDLTVSLARVPALPASRFIIENVRLRT
jgi:fatty-acid peroxygenase